MGPKRMRKCAALATMIVLLLGGVAAIIAGIVIGIDEDLGLVLLILGIVMIVSIPCVPVALLLNKAFSGKMGTICWTPCKYFGLGLLELRSVDTSPAERNLTCGAFVCATAFFSAGVWLTVVGSGHLNGK